MRRLAVPLLIALAFTAGEIRLDASSTFSDVPVPGGMAELARVLDLPTLPPRDRLIVELTRLLYDTEPGRDSAADQRLARLSAHFASLVAPPDRDAAQGRDASGDTVPVPLTPALWSLGILHRTIASDALLPELLLNRRASLLAHGLYALDDGTLTYLSAHPALLDYLYDHAAGRFAAFGEAVRIDGGRVRVPGGAAAEPLWESVVGERPANAERFVRALFVRHEGRLAYLFHALTHLDAARTAFALGLWMPDAEAREDRFRVLVGSLGAFPGLEFDLRPFSRPAEDIVLLLTRIRTDAKGAPSPPQWRRLWRRAFEGMDVPGDRTRLVKDLEEDGVIDAAWLSQMLAGVDFRFRAERMDQVTFGQRVFGSAAPHALPDVVAALRAFPISRMLMVTLERIGVHTPGLYVAAARRADQLSGLDRERAVVALSQFQGATALVERFIRVRSLDPITAERLIAHLVDVPLVDGRYAGAVSRWTRDQLGPAVGLEATAADQAWIAALAGPPPATTVRVDWEDEAYRVDFAAPERRRLTRALQVPNRIALSRVFDELSIAETLAAPNRTLADVRSAADRLGPLRSDRHPAVDRAIRDLSKISRPGDLNDAASVARSLLVTVDDDLADALRMVVYALSDGHTDDDASPRLAGASRRHDFGFGVTRGEVRMRAAWTEPVESVGGGSPWRVTGSLLGLELGLSMQSLRSLTVEGVPTAPVLNANQARVFSRTVALLNPADLAESDLDALLQAIGRGRERVAALAGIPANLPPLADEIRLDGWRRRLIENALALHPERAASYLSMAELTILGQPGPTFDLDAWGMAGSDDDGCPCVRFFTPGLWSVLIGRGKTGVLATQVPDLNLRIAERLRELRLPGSLLKDVLAVAAQDYVDRVKPLHAYDWLTLVQEAQNVTPDRVADIVASLTAFGPLVPDQPAAAEELP